MEAGVAPLIGRPVHNTYAYVLDAFGQPAPVGVIGELYLGGAGVARGYLGRPDLTAMRFVPDPFSGEPGARMYRTGDRVRCLADGNLEYLGRLDGQVKIRGYRIELGEVESVLRRHPAVAEAVVVTRDRYPRRQAAGRLCGARMPRRSAAASWPAFCKQQLPPYMLPAAFVLLDALPLSPNGKLDRRALPTPVYATPRGDTSSPRTATEQQLIALWSELLGVEQVGVDDDFFALGGHSLLAAELMFRLQAALDVDLPLRTIFEAPTIAALAERVDAGRQMQQPSAGLPIRPVARSGELPLSFAQQRYWFLQQLEPHNPVYNVCFAVRLAGQLDLRALEQSLQAVVQRHEALRTTFESRGSAAVQLIHAQQPIAFASVDLSAVPETEREAHAQRLLVAEAQAPVDLRAGPTVRALVLRLHDAEHILLLATHHMVFDGSHDIFFRELSALYRVFAHGDITSIARALPELPVQYADFAAWQREQVAGKALDTQLAFGSHSSAATRLRCSCPPTGRGRRCRPSVAQSSRSSSPLASSTGYAS